MGIVLWLLGLAIQYRFNRDLLGWLEAGPALIVFTWAIRTLRGGGR